MSSTPKVAGIVLAAGKSSRMGRPKLLLPFRGQTVLECVVDSALQTSLHPIVVVLGDHAATLRPLLEPRDVILTLNPDYDGGQSTSLKAGLNRVKDQVDGVLFLLGDQPLIAPQTINRLLDVYTRTRSAIVLPVFKGRRGNPVLFDRGLFPRILNLSEDTGARILFEEYRDHILRVPVQDASIHFDIDTEEDYQKLLSKEQSS